MTKRPCIAIIAYGSILNPNDLEDLFGDVDGRAAPVKVRGFKRIFNQEASWRDFEGLEKAVLNVVRSSDDWFNGVIVTDLDRSEFREFRERERGYRLVEVESKMIEQYDAADAGAEMVSSRPDIQRQDLILTTTGKKSRGNITPIDSYVDLCREGAMQWGDAFLQDFVQTTRVNSGTSLFTYLDEE